MDLLERLPSTRPPGPKNMKPTSHQTSYSKHGFREQTGYIVDPWLVGATNDWVAIRHSASVPPWVDGDVHFHTDAEEYFLVLQGELRLLIDGTVFTLRPYEALLVRPQVPHAVVGGRGPIEHFVLRMPACDDRQSVDERPAEFPPTAYEAKRALELDWGCRVPLDEARYQNCWLFGFGQALFHSEHLCMAYVDLPTEESINADTHPHRLHLHQESWEYYVALQGTRVLQIDERLVEINEGEILEVPPGTKHVLHATSPPFKGIEFRVPQRDDKIMFPGRYRLSVPHRRRQL